ncbi:hypothetical protein ARMGADRAFT_1077549 [Armillaria gallica]|uniref:CCHC-type domain-containing protein n=1 Tax=Armillaria gallica TaxID=47427 RepID=A0A2H3DLE1_ARMGA|nr:hypothetical protein ARMGADRAFT_1077549 [Armillaria gallica]
MRQAFKDAKWDDTDESVEGWKDLLKQLVDDMDIPPDDYSAKSKFMECLPRHIQSCIFADKMLVEYNSLEELYQAGLDAEYAVKAERRFAKSTKNSKDNNERPEQTLRTMEVKMPRYSNFGSRRWIQTSQPQQAGVAEPKLTDKHQHMERRPPPATRQTKPRIPEARVSGNENGGQQRSIICFRCGKEGHIASSQECPENGKKPSYAQIQAAHTIIMDAISKSVGAEEHPKAKGDDEAEDGAYDNVDMEIYDDDEEDSVDSEGNIKMMNYIADTADDDSWSNTDSRNSDDEVMYGNPREDDDTELMQTIPLSEFGGPTPDSATSPVLRIRVNPRQVE